MAITISAQDALELFRDAHAVFAAALYDRVADDLERTDRKHSASADPRGYSAGYHEGRAETIQAVAEGLRQLADQIREQPALALDPPGLRLL